MARTVKKYEERKQEILEAAKALFFRHGYEKTTVNMVIEAAGISKGNFYHYFDSKEELVETLADRMTEDLVEKVRRAVSEPGLSAVERLNRFIEVGIREKVFRERRLVHLFLSVMFSDENIRLREKLNSSATELTKQVLVPVVRQGIEEGVFNTPYPEEATVMLLELGNSVRKHVAHLLLAIPGKPELWPALENKVMSYLDAIERILGAPRGCIDSLNMDVYREFMKPLQQDVSNESQRNPAD